MSRPVVFNALWLLSERDASARHLAFHPGKTLIAGGNGTGKSRILKHIVWALGCEPPRRTSGEFDSNVVVALDLTVGTRKLTFLRQNRKQAAFDEFGLLLFATQSATAWAKYFAEVFDFPLQLQRTSDERFDYAGPSIALLPFYIDQDSGWGTKWAGFTNFGQFAKWQSLPFTAFTGLKPTAWVRNQHRSEAVGIRLKTAKMHAKLQESSYERVVAMLPSDTTAIDEKQFAEELRDLSDKAQTLRAQQDEVRKKLLALALERQRRNAEFQMALASERELVEDQAFLAGYKDAEPLVCPTCSHVHTTTFLARQALAEDAHDIHHVVIRLQGHIDALNAKEAALQTDLNTVSAKLKSLHDSLSVERDGRPVADVVVAKSLSTLKLAYDITRRELAAEIDTLSEEKKGIDEELAALTDKGREKRIRTYFAEDAKSFADQLGIDRTEVSQIKIGSRSPSSSGSNAPRAVLAMHLALLSTHAQYGEGPTFPFIVDTPQQSGQDLNSLSRMLTTTLTASKGQAFVATEMVPDGWETPSDSAFLVLQTKRGLLKESEFKRGVKELGPMVLAMMAELSKQESAEEDDSAPEPDADHGGEDDEDDEN